MNVGATGITTVTFTATDDCDNTSTTQATFTIEDTSEPEIVDPAVALNIECSSADQQAEIDAWWLLNNGGATATDACSPIDIVWTHNYTVGGENTECGATGTVLVTFVAADNCGLQVITTAAITITDTTVPDITIEAADEVVECDGLGNTAQLQTWLDTNGGAEATDECSEVTWSYVIDNETDDCGFTSVISVTFTATDDCDNESTTTATFTIEDTTNPEIVDPAEPLNIECSEMTVVQTSLGKMTTL